MGVDIFGECDDLVAVCVDDIDNFLFGFISNESHVKSSCFLPVYSDAVSY